MADVFFHHPDGRIERVYAKVWTEMIGGRKHLSPTKPVPFGSAMYDPSEKIIHYASAAEAAPK